MCLALLLANVQSWKSDRPGPTKLHVKLCKNRSHGQIIVSDLRS